MTFVLPIAEGILLQSLFPNPESIRCISYLWNPISRVPRKSPKWERVESRSSAQMELAHGGPVPHTVSRSFLDNSAVALKLAVQHLAYWNSKNHIKESSQLTPDTYRLRMCNFDESAQTSAPMKFKSLIFLKLKFEFPLCEANPWGLVIELSPLFNFKATWYIYLYHRDRDINSSQGTEGTPNILTYTLL